MTKLNHNFMHLLTVTKASFWIYSCIKQTSKDGDSIRCFSHCHVVIINYHFFKILLFEKSTRLKNIWFVSRVMSRVLDSWVEPLDSFRACWRVWFFADFRFFNIEDVPVYVKAHSFGFQKYYILYYFDVLSLLRR